MANLHHHHAMSRRREVRVLTCKGTFGSSGAVTDAGHKNGAVISFTSTTGRYTVTLDGKYSALLAVHFGVSQVSGTAANTGHWTLRTDAVASAGTVELNHCLPNDPTSLQHPVSGDAVYVTLVVADSAVI